MEFEQPYVLVLCLTYNQSLYIEDTLNGFCMQQTDFPFVCCILDDASTDGEIDVIKKYTNESFEQIESTYTLREDSEDYCKLFLRHKINRNCFFLIFFLKYNHYQIGKSKLPYYEEWKRKAKYIAYCEGDDYWIDPLKLQKQVDFLEKHPDYGLVHTNFKIIDATNKEIGDIKERGKLLKKYEGNGIEEILILLGIKTLTFCVRKEFVPAKKIAEGIFSGDKYLALNVASQTKIHYLPDVTGVYRSLSGTMCHSPNYFVADKFERSIQRLDDHYMNITPNLSNKTKMLMRFKWGHYELLYKLANNDTSINTIPNLIYTIPYIRIKEYKFVVMYLLCHNKFFFNLFRNKLLKNKYYQV